MSRPRRIAPLVIGLVAVAALTSCSPAPRGDPAASPAVPGPVSASPDVTPTPTKMADRGPQPLPASAAVRVTSVSIPTIDLKTSRLEELDLLEDGSLAAPRNPDRAGWFADGAVPGEVGPAVIAGHVDSTTGPAVFHDLAQVEQGDLVTVGLSDGTQTRFRVDRVVTTAKKGFPTETVFGPTPDAELRLITCSGPYDRDAGYLDNTIVFATRITAAAQPISPDR